MILLIDNYDSFTYNLVQLLEQMEQEVSVFRNDRIDMPEIESLQPSALMISPGPGTPADSGISLEAIGRLGPKIPVLGVCLGHQCIGQAFGGEVIRARRIMHGKTSMIYHRSQGVFLGLPQPFEATRYHSLVLDKESIPECLSVMAWTEDGDENEIMGLKHVEFDVEGVQFHPESILTTSGHDLLRNFLQKISMRF